ncbi:hypothetical protein PIB30_075209 [Stylosanthes scabra]|uniref:Leucine-rich repeat-containing N-terminal plant-type domain-containing protein n=1 Tax=Stylosanthes scabra TaxID=79078 RepID=A0ABU6RQ99_9FABA|nr:hypothetical protein [Stylosanthes scabra]
MMRCFVLSFTLFFLLILHTPSSTSSSLLPLCNHHDNSNLLYFKNSFPIDNSLYRDGRCSSYSNKIASWKNGTDCCHWDGVTCDTSSGHVIGLDLSCSMLEGPFDPNSTLFHLTHLQQLNLAFNDFHNSPIHPQIGDLVNLSHLNLSSSSFSGDIPSTISHLSKLLSLDLSDDYELRLDESTWSKIIANTTNLKELVLDLIDMSSIKETSLSLLMNFSSSLLSLSLRNTGLHGKFPSGILALPNLQELRLSKNEELKGELPKSNNWSTPLRILDLTGTAFSGQIPDSIGHLKSLNQLFLWYCKFDGMIPLSLWNLTQLTELHLSRNTLHGEIPSLLSNLKHLTILDLSYNSFGGQLPSSLLDLTQLSVLDISSNLFIGPIPSKNATLSKLHTLDLHNNSINGTIPDWCYSLTSLTLLDLSMNQLTGPISKFYIGLQNLINLDLSNNKIHGKIPNWFRDNLLHTWKDLVFLDLSFNKLQGDLPIPPYGIEVFSVTNNNFTGHISSTFCNASSLDVLILSHNHLSGTIPQCLLGASPFLSILDLQVNNFHGSIPTNFSQGSELQTIKLNHNQLEGVLPKSLASCTQLEVLDVAENNIEDVFPNWLQTLPALQVLSLRANKFHGTITTSFNAKHPFPKLRIFDVSNNKFGGPLPTSLFENFQGMKELSDSTHHRPALSYMNSSFSKYTDSVVVIIKGQSMELVRILTIFTTIDLSNNMFNGEIPHVIGELTSLIGLNLSHNQISGIIPQTLGNLTSLEWLDLSWNQLEGEIPVSLTNLNFLAVLNLSENHLEGMIPTGKQFNTFENDSYIGNPMLCGFPLSKSCKNDEEQPPSSILHQKEKPLFGWKSVAAGYGCGMVFGMILGRLFIKTARPLWLARLLCGYTY